MQKFLNPSCSSSSSSSSSCTKRGAGQNDGKMGTKRARKKKSKPLQESEVAQSLRRLSRSDLEGMVMTSVINNVAITAEQVKAGAPKPMEKGIVAKQSSFDASNQVGSFSPFDEDVMCSIFLSLNTRERLEVTTVVCSGWLALRGTAEYWQNLNLAELRSCSSTAFNRLIRHTIPLTHVKQLTLSSRKDNIGPDYKDFVNLFKQNQMSSLTALDVSGPRITNMVIKEIGKRVGANLESLTTRDTKSKPDDLFEIVKLAPSLTRLCVHDDVASPEDFLSRLSSMAKVTRGEGSSSIMTTIELSNKYSFQVMSARHFSRMASDFPELEKFIIKGLTLCERYSHPVTTAFTAPFSTKPFSRLRTLVVHDLESSPGFGWGEKAHEPEDVVNERVETFFSAIFETAPALLCLTVTHVAKWVSRKDFMNGVRSPPQPTIKFAVSTESLESLTLSRFHISNQSFDEFLCPNLKTVRLTQTERESGRGGGYSSCSSSASSSSDSGRPTPEQWVAAKFGEQVKGVALSKTLGAD